MGRRVRELLEQLGQPGERDLPIARRADLETSHQATIDALQEEIDRIQASADAYARQVAEAEESMEQRVERIRADQEDEADDLRNLLDAERTKVAQLTDLNRSLKERVNAVTISGRSEADLVDGRVARMLDSDEVFIDLGRKHNIVLGMTFDVYSNPTPPGKATIEVTRVDDATSRARVVRSTIGRAVVEGDILVNPVYDPDKEYSFYVFGDFDLDLEDGPSPQETDIVKARIREWGGTIRDEFTGDIDYLVLGMEPVEPSPLPPSPTGPQVRQYQQQKRLIDRYEALLEEARSLSIPVLNQNRLFTLIGYYR